MKRYLFSIFVITILLVSCNNNKISFSIITDSDFDYKKRDLSIKYLKDNCLVAKRGRNIISKFYTHYGNILRIDSITDNIIKLHYELNLKAEQLEIARKNSGVMWIQFVNERFEMVLIYPEDLKSDGGNSFKLIDMYQSNNFIKLTYDYIEEIGIPNLGKGTVVFSFKKNEFGKFELEDYEYDVKGYFIQGEKGQLISSEKGDIVIAQNTTRDILLNNFTLDTENIYGGLN